MACAHPSTKPLCGPDILTLRRTERGQREQPQRQEDEERSGSVKMEEEDAAAAAACGRVLEHVATWVSACSASPVMVAGALLPAPDPPAAAVMYRGRAPV